MANANFVVHNGLTVGPLTIDAATGSISTTGTVSVTGGLAVSTISKNDSSITINDTGTGSTVYVTIDGTTEHTIDANGVNLASGDWYAINGTSVLNATTLGSGVTASSLTSVGTLGSLTVSGSMSAGSFTVPTASQPNITTLAGVTSIGAGGLTTTVVGNLAVGGNLTVSGTSVSIGASTLSISDPIINLGSPTDLAPLTSQTTADIGIKIHYYDGSDKAAFFGRAVDSGYLEWYDKGTDTANVFTGTEYGTIKSGAMIVANSTASSSTTTGALKVTGGAGIAGAVYIGDVLNVAGASTFTGATTHNGGLSGTTGSFSSTLAVTSTSTFTGATTHNGGLTTPSISKNGTNGSGDIGSSANRFATVYAATFSGVSTTAQYADLAENYLGDTAYTAGQVVEFGGDAEVTLGTADSTRVAGIVSTNPAHLMNGGLTGNNVVPLALMGRVPCNVIGPIKKGDMLVSAGFGYAKASANPTMGQVIGKALADFGGAKGQIEVVVGRM